jgi:hypothetical protein
MRTPPLIPSPGQTGKLANGQSFKEPEKTCRDVPSGASNQWHRKFESSFFQLNPSVVVSLGGSFLTHGPSSDGAEAASLQRVRLVR